MSPWQTRAWHGVLRGFNTEAPFFLQEPGIPAGVGSAWPPAPPLPDSCTPPFPGSCWRRCLVQAGPGLRPSKLLAWREGAGRWLGALQMGAPGW